MYLCVTHHDIYFSYWTYSKDIGYYRQLCQAVCDMRECLLFVCAFLRNTLSVLHCAEGVVWSMEPPLHADLFQDFGDLSCGDLVIALLKLMRPLSTGTVLEIRAVDPAAPVDIGAWCRMRGHTLLAGPCGSDHARYFIRKEGVSSWRSSC